MITAMEAIKPGMTLGLLFGDGSDRVVALYPVHEVTYEGVIFWNEMLGGPGSVWRWGLYDDRGQTGYVHLRDAKGRYCVFKVLNGREGV